jgi:solute:Na+ symporter, SSS family
VGLDTENAYLKICQLVLPPGLLGLMLTGMYFSTSASANTALNVVSAVFTNDIYKGIMNPQATDRQLIQVARGSSWVFGLGMIGIALLVPAAGGIVEVVLSISAITGGPLLAPPIWALFSKRLTGRATLLITSIGLTVNLFAKIVLPMLFAVKLSRAWETAIGVGLPLLLLLAYELWMARRSATQRNAGGLAPAPTDFDRYGQTRDRKRTEALLRPETADEARAVRQQNRFGLQVIAGALVFTALMLVGLSMLATAGAVPTSIVGVVIGLSALIPWRAARQTNV